MRGDATYEALMYRIALTAWAVVALGIGTLIIYGFVR